MVFCFTMLLLFVKPPTRQSSKRETAQNPVFLNSLMSLGETPPCPPQGGKLHRLMILDALNIANKRNKSRRLCTISLPRGGKLHPLMILGALNIAKNGTKAEGFALFPSPREGREGYTHDFRYLKFIWKRNNQACYSIPGMDFLTIISL